MIRVPLIERKDDLVAYYVEYDERYISHVFSCTVFEAISWHSDKNEPIEFEEYCSASIKWDGCSHITSGTEETALHLCGRHCFDQYIEVLNALWKMASEKIEAFNAEIAE